MRFRILWAALACFSLVLPVALAQTTGEVYGVVRDKDGSPLPGATVTISGPQIPTGRTTTTIGDGAFRFGGLIPGNYKLRADFPGMGSFNQDVVVGLGKTTEVYPTLRVTATAEVTVTAATPIVDTKSTTVSNVTDRATIEQLPLARTFAGTFQLAPGVADSGVAVSSTNPGFNAGGGRQDNTFLYDGVNVTNPFFGDLFQDFTGLDLQEVNITRGGLSAEFGRTGGFVVNGVTKSGTNTFHGEARVEYQPSGASAKSKDPTLTSQFNKVRPGASVGGPILPDRLFFYGSASFLRQTEEDRVNNVSALPDSDFDINEYFGKLTSTPFPNHLIEASFRYRGITQTNADIGTRGTPSQGDNPKGIDRIGVASWFWAVNSRFNIEAKYNHNENHNGAEPITFLGYKPPFDHVHPELVGNYDNGTIVAGGAAFAINDDDFFRNEYKLTASHFANFLRTTHDIRFGFSYSDNREDLARLANGWGAITLSTSSNCGPASARPCYRARYNPLQPPQISRAHTYGIFAQDQMTWNRLTVNLGVLLNKDTYIPNDNQAFTFIQGSNFRTPNSVIKPCSDPTSDPNGCTYTNLLRFGFSKQIQPRAGVAYEIDQKAHDKVYANFARYDNLDNQSIARAAAPLRLARNDAYFNRTAGIFIKEVPTANETGKKVLGHIDPTYTDEYLAGYARPLGAGFAAEVWGMYRRTTDIIEDFSANGNEFSLDASPSDYRYGNISGFRKYKAATFELRKTGNDKPWTADLSYTWSRLEGNWDLDYAVQLFYASSIIADGPGLYPTDPNREGILTGDRTHVAKLFGSYQLPTNTVVGGYLRFQSGVPWEIRGFDPTGQSASARLYLEPAGSRRTSSWTNLDLLVAQNIPLGSVGTLRVEGRLLNVFNTQPPLSVDQRACLNPPCLAIPAAGDPNANPNLGRATSYAPARRFIASGTFSF